jgi:hypothetical protein
MLARSPIPSTHSIIRSGVAVRSALSRIDLRADRRFTVEVGGVLHVEGSTSAVYVVTVRDISKSGLRISCPVPLRDGIRIEVDCCHTRVAGEVRYCREVFADEFHVGIKADERGIDLAPFLESILRHT